MKQCTLVYLHMELEVVHTHNNNNSNKTESKQSIKRKKSLARSLSPLFLQLDGEYREGEGMR